MGHQLKKYIFTLIVCSIYSSLPGQELPVKTYGIRQGLSQGAVADLLQDEERFLWAATKNGLNRFDGRRFTVFSADPEDPCALSNDHVSALCEYGDFLLVGTEDGGLNIFHKKTHCFYRIPEFASDSIKYNLQNILSVYLDADKNIWLVENRKDTQASLYKIKVPPGFWERFLFSSNRWEGLSVEKYNHYVVQYAFMNSKGTRFYVPKTGQLITIDTKTGEVAAVYEHPAVVHFSSIIEDSEGKIYVSARHRILRLDGGELKEWLHTDFEACRLQFFRPENHLLLEVYRDSIERSELFYYDLSNVESGEILNQEKSLFSVKIKYFGKSITDHSGNIWIATNGVGLAKINFFQGRFKTFFNGASIATSVVPVGKDSYAFVSGKGFLRFSSNDPHPLRSPELPMMDYRTRYVRDRKGDHWFLFRRLHSSYQLCRVPAQGGSPQVFLLDNYAADGGACTVDDQGNILVGLSSALYRFDPETEQISRFSYELVLPEPHEVRMLEKRVGGGWWLATSKGLIEAVPEGEGFNFHRYVNIPYDLTSLRNNNIACLLVDPADSTQLLIGTKGSGLDRLDTRTGKFVNLTKKINLPDNTIYGVLADDQGYLWMSSNRGLIRYDPKTGKINHYTTEDGLQDDEFNTWVFGKGLHGEFMFGGVQGLNVFHPRDFQDNPIPPKVYITALKVMGAAVTPRDSTNILLQAIEFTDKIRLPFKYNSIELEFAALEFTAPARNRFRYYLQGAEGAWAHESGSPTAQYLNLAPGTYTFRVMASNGDGIWNENPGELQITILPPWYRSIWAYTIYIGVAGGLLYGLLRNRQRQWKLRQALAFEHREAKRIRELDQFKSRLFTNITHEFRTPLTVILGTADYLQKQAEQRADQLAALLKSRLPLIQLNGSSLLNLINQLLDLARAENNQLKVDMVQADLVRYVRYVAESFHSLANQGNVLLRVESRLTELVMDYDPEKMRQILTNLIANALKYTPSGGQVWIRIGKEPPPGEIPQVNGSGSMARLEVTDTGPGILPKDLPHVFDRFYQADNSIAKAGGTGIGLALTRELIKLLGGEIAVESTPGQGATFIARLPITNNSPERAFDPAPAGPVVLENPALPAYSTLAGTQNAPSAGGEHPSVLIVEDNPDVVEYLRLCLEGHYRLDFAYNGRAGIERALELIPDLIVSDVMMPEKDGLELCDTLKNDERSSHIPIVLLTAKADIDSRLAGLRRGADAYLAKPFHTEELLVTLQKLLDNRRRLQVRYSRLAVETAGAASGEKAAPETALEDEFIQKLRAILEERLDDPDLSREAVCRAMGMSQSNLYAKLSALTGLSFNVYLRTLRLYRAKFLLETSDLNVSEVAYRVGFNDPKYFSRVFTEQFGVTASSVRKQ